jgi:hypothetical protein
MLSFMKKSVRIVFINALAILSVIPANALAESAFSPAAVQKTQVSSHLDFSIVIQPSLSVRVHMQSKQPNNGGQGDFSHDNDLQIVSAAITVQGNSGSISLNSAESPAELTAESVAVKPGEPLGERFKSADSSQPRSSPSSGIASAMLLPAVRKLVYAERHFDCLRGRTCHPSRSATLTPGASGRLVYTVSQL